VQDVTDEVQSSELARNWRAIYNERRNNNIGNLGVALLRNGQNIHFKHTSFDASACSKLKAMHRASSPREPLSDRSMASKRFRANLPSFVFRVRSLSDSSAESVEKMLL
jgi:hypothetical protein